MSEAAHDGTGFDFSRPVFVSSYMVASRIAGSTGGPQTVLVAVFRRNDAVGGHQDGAVEAFEFFLLFPPGVPIVAGEVLVFLEERIVMSRQHFGMGVYIHASALGLIQQHFQVFQVVTGDQDARVLAHADVHSGNFRVAVSRGVGFVQQSHALYAVFTGFQSQGNQVVHGFGIIQGSSQSALDESIHFFVVLGQYVGMFAVGRQTFQAVGDQFAQGTDVFVFGSQYADGLGFGIEFCFSTVPQSSFRQVSGVTQLSQQVSFHFQGIFDPVDDGFPVEVGVGDGGEQVDSHQMVHVAVNVLSCSPQSGGHSGQTLGHVDQQILHSSHFRLLAADTHDGAAFAAGGFLTLIAEHLVFHSLLPFSSRKFYSKDLFLTRWLYYSQSRTANPLFKQHIKKKTQKFVLTESYLSQCHIQRHHDGEP